MSKVLEKLHEEHRNIDKLLRILKRETESLAAGEYTNFNLITDIMHYFENFPDVHHHPNEDIIFNRLREKEPSCAVEVDRITNEHEHIASASKTIHDEISQLQGNAIFERQELVKKLNNFIEDYYSHMNAEEELLLPQVEKVMGKNDWDIIDAEIKIQDDPLFGEILDNQYKQLYTEILAEAG